MSVRWVKNMTWKNHWRSWRIPWPFLLAKIFSHNSETPKQTPIPTFLQTFFQNPPQKHSIFFPQQQNANLQGYHRCAYFVCFACSTTTACHPPHHKGHPPVECVDGFLTQKGHLQLLKSCGVVCHLPEADALQNGWFVTLKHRKVVFQPSIFRGYVSFRAGKCFRKQWFL